MPFSRSRSMESMIRSVNSAPSRKAPDCRRRWSTSVVLPWSTWAMMATLRIGRAMVGAVVTEILGCGRGGLLAGEPATDHVAPGLEFGVGELGDIGIVNPEAGLDGVGIDADR